MGTVQTRSPPTQLLLTVALTTVCWVTTAFIPPGTNRQVLIEFYRKVRPFGPGWKRIRAEAGPSAEHAASTHENIPLALVGWVAGCTVIWSALFTVGNYLYGRMGLAALLLGVFVASGVVLIGVVKILWTAKPSARAREAELAQAREEQ